MLQIQFFDHDGRPTGPWLAAARARQGLASIGIHTGRLRPPDRPLSRVPQLTYARELADLRRRFNIAMTYRTWQRADALADALSESADTLPRSTEPGFGHTHDDHEVRVVLQGQLAYLVPASALHGWAAVVAGPGTWLALPPGLPHALKVVSDPDGALDVLSLYSKPAGWVPVAADMAMPSALSDLAVSARSPVSVPSA